MLEQEQMGKDYNKAQLRRALIETTGRTDASIQFKHRNISAVMLTLGLPRISGYSPLWNIQSALFEAVENHLNERPDLYKLLIGEAETLKDRSEESLSGETIVFDKAPPIREMPDQGILEDIEPSICRFEHPAERDARNRDLGKAGELLVYEYERNRLQEIGRNDLSEQVRWVAEDDGDGYGYDILSFSGEGNDANKKLLFEVKTTNGSASTPFYITNNELRVSKERPDAFRIIRLYDFRKQVRAFRLAPPLENHVSLFPTIFRASF